MTPNENDQRLSKIKRIEKSNRLLINFIDLYGCVFGATTFLAKFDVSQVKKSGDDFENFSLFVLQNVEK